MTITTNAIYLMSKPVKHFRRTAIKDICIYWMHKIALHNMHAINRLTMHKLMHIMVDNFIKNGSVYRHHIFIFINVL